MSSPGRDRRVAVASRAGSAVVALLTGLTVVLGAPTSAFAAPLPAPIMTGYVPLPADAFVRVMKDASSSAGSTLDFTVGITNAATGSVMYYDHWEDGFETDLTDPSQPTTEVWGDGDSTDGNAATYCASCAGDLLTPGDVFVLRNNVATPRNAAVVRFDGRDKIASTRGFAITAGGFSTSLGSVLAGTVSAYDTSKFGTDYVAPVGEDTAVPAGTSDAFATSSLVVTAAQDGTTVTVDKDDDGIADLVETVDEGEVVFANGGVLEGATVTATGPVQVHQSAGDPTASYESRWFTLFPTTLLSADYLNPVGSTVNNQRTITYLYNLGSSDIVVTPTCIGCSGSIALAAGSGRSFASPVGQAVRFTSVGGEAFVAVGAGGAQSGAAPGSPGDNSHVYDYGFSLVPTGLLTSQAVLGWAPGNAAKPPSAAGAGARDYDPVWFSALAATTVHVDFDGDPSTGLIGTADCDGARHDQELVVSALASTRIVDTVDGDMTGARVYTCDGTKIAGAWGEDPANAPSGSPGFDAGYAIIPTTTMLVDKSAGMAVDANGDGRIGPGDSVEYDVTIADAGSLAFTDVEIDDALPGGTTYASGTTVFDDGVTTVAIPDDAPAATTTFPLDEGGSSLPNIAAGQTVHVRYVVSIDDPFLAGGTSVTNTVSVTASEASSSATLVTELASSDLSLTKTVTSAPTYVGDAATFRVAVHNDGPDAATGVVVADLLPVGLAFLGATASQGTYDAATGLWAAGDLADGADATLDITATTLTTPVANFAQIVRSGSTDTDSQPAENTLGTGNQADQDDEASATVSPLTSADLSLAKAITASPDADGDTTFRLTVTNAGPNDATGVVVAELPPVGSTFVSAFTSAGSFAADTNLWTVGPVASGTAVTLDVTYTITSAPADNLAQISAAGQDDPDSAPGENAFGPDDPADQDDEAAVTVPAVADLSLVKTVSAPPQFVGENVTYTLSVANAGPAAATGVAVTDLLPAGLDFVSAGPGQGSYDPVDGVWTVGTVGSGATATIDIVARVTTAGTIANTAEITAAASTDPDSTPGNDAGAEDDRSTATFATTGATLGAVVHYDRNHDDAYDAGDPAQAGDFTATWYGPDETLGTADDEVFTAAGGADFGTGLPGGTYRVTVEGASLPAGLTTAAYDPDGVGSAGAAVVTLPSGASQVLHFGYVGTGVIGDTVFVDRDDDGIAGPGEGLGGAAVDLEWAGPDGSFGTADDVTTSAVTTAGGAYRFDALPAGSFRLVVSGVPAGLVGTVDPDGGADSTSIVALDAGDVVDTQDFGYAGTGSVTGTAWNDVDADGTQGLEPGLDGVTVTLLLDSDLDGSFETTIATALTGPTGAYRFGHLVAGSYRVDVATPAGRTPTTSEQVPVTLTDGGSGTADFGSNVPTADLSLTKVIVAGPAADGDTTFRLTLANAGPNPATSVVVAEVPPPGSIFVSAAPASGTFDGSTNRWTVPSLASGAQTTLDVVYAVTSAPSDNLVEVTEVDQADPDSQPADGPLDADNPPDQDDEATVTVPAVVDLSVDVNVVSPPSFVGDTVQITVDVTNAGPAAATDTFLTVTVPAGLVLLGTAAEQGSFNALSGVWDLGTVPLGATLRLTLTARVTAPGFLTTTGEVTAAGGTDLDSTPGNHVITEDDLDFATVITAGATLLGEVRNDRNGDDAYQSTDPRVSGDLTATWFGPDDTLGTPDDETFTATSGDAFGSGLPGGRYQVTVDPTSLPAGLDHPAYDPDGTTDAHTAVVTLAPGGSTTARFGYAGTGAVGDRVFGDTDGNGTQDLGEPGLGGVTVTLLLDGDGNGSFETSVATAVTSGQGDYRFTGLAPGSYQVSVDGPTGQMATTATSMDVVLAAGETRDDADFGFAPPAAPGGAFVGDRVWADLDGDGTQDSSEPGLAGVTVGLRTDPDGDGQFDTVAATQLTGGDGSYGFANLPAGTYRISITVPTDRSATTAPAVTVALTAGAMVDTVDFGLAATTATPVTGSIGDRVWDDLDADGAQDSGEPGTAGVTVTLRQDHDGDAVYETVVSSTVTGVDGSYSFAALDAGAYQLVLTVPEGSSPTTSPARPVDLAAGRSVTDADFGLAGAQGPTGSVGDRVWSDGSHDGVQDAGEPGVNGVTVTLRQDIDGDGRFETVAASQVTAGDGGYRFDGLAPGRYLVTVTPPLGESTTTPDARTVTLGAGEAVVDADFGVATAAPVPYDLALTKALEAGATTGAPATWLLRVRNNGLVASPTPITVTDSLPAGLTYVSMSGTGWTCSATGPVVTCTRAAALAVGEWSDLHLVTTVTGQPGVELVNGASVIADGIETTLANNADAAGITVEPAPPTTTTTTTTAPPTDPTTTPPPASRVPTPTTARPPTGLARLPHTGADLVGMGLLGGMLLVVGAGLRRSSRRS